jgi:hypothetical protein
MTTRIEITHEQNKKIKTFLNNAKDRQSFTSKISKLTSNQKEKIISQICEEIEILRSMMTILMEGNSLNFRNNTRDLNNIQNCFNYLNDELKLWSGILSVEEGSGLWGRIRRIWHRPIEVSSSLLKDILDYEIRAIEEVISYRRKNWGD